MGANNEIIIDDGSKEYIFKNTSGEEFARFSFNPADPNIITRYDNVVDFFENSKFLEDENEDTTKQVVEMNKELERQFDILCGKKVSDSLFERYAPLTLFPDGSFYAEIVIKKISEFIEEELNVRLDKKKAKIRKEIAKNRS